MIRKKSLGRRSEERRQMSEGNPPRRRKTEDRDQKTEKKVICSHTRDRWVVILWKSVVDLPAPWSGVRICGEKHNHGLPQIIKNPILTDFSLHYSSGVMYARWGVHVGICIEHFHAKSQIVFRRCIVYTVFAFIRLVKVFACTIICIYFGFIPFANSFEDIHRKIIFTVVMCHRI